MAGMEGWQPDLSGFVSVASVGQHDGYNLLKASLSSRGFCVSCSVSSLLILLANMTDVTVFIHSVNNCCVTRPRGGAGDTGDENTVPVLQGPQPSGRLDTDSYYG